MYHDMFSSLRHGCSGSTAEYKIKQEHKSVIPVVDSDSCIDSYIVCVLVAGQSFLLFFPRAVHWVVYPWHGIGPAHAKIFRFN